MKKPKDYTLLALAIPFVFAVLVNLPGCYQSGQHSESKPSFVHHCEWLGCKNEGEATFTSDSEEGTDSYYFDLNHFTHPEWSETECDEMIFTKHPLRDYQIEVTQDSILVFDGLRKVGATKWDNSKLDSLLLNDNQ